MIVIVCLTCRAWGTCRAAFNGDLILSADAASGVIFIGLETGLAGITATTGYGNGTVRTGAAAG